MGLHCNYETFEIVLSQDRRQRQSRRIATRKTGLRARNWFHLLSLKVEHESLLGIDAVISGRGFLRLLHRVPYLSLFPSRARNRPLEAGNRRERAEETNGGNGRGEGNHQIALALISLSERPRRREILAPLIVLSALGPPNQHA